MKAFGSQISSLRAEWVGESVTLPIGSFLFVSQLNPASFSLKGTIGLVILQPAKKKKVSDGRF